MFIPRILEGVYVLRGAEANILQPDGRLDIPDIFKDRSRSGQFEKIKKEA